MTLHIPAACLLVARMYAAGYRTREIAELRGTSLNTVHSQIRTARAILRRHGHAAVGNAIKLGLTLDALYGPDTTYYAPQLHAETA